MYNRPITFGEYLLSITTKEELEYLKGKDRKCDSVRIAKKRKSARASVRQQKPT